MKTKEARSRETPARRFLRAFAMGAPPREPAGARGAGIRGGVGVLALLLRMGPASGRPTRVRAWALGVALLASGCVSRSYTYYLIEPAPRTNPALEEPEGTQVRPLGFGSSTAMQVRWNDGNVITEVQIPMLASGQRILVEHTPSATDVQTIPATRLVPPPPTAADATLEDAYRQRGLRVNPDAPQVSLTRARTLMQEALAEGNHQLALEWCALILERYPSHPETLRAQGSILLLLGEREKAIEVWERVEEIETDPAVRSKLEELRRQAVP